MLDYLRTRAVPGVEAVEGDTWRRTLPGGEVRVRVTDAALAVSLTGDLGRLRLADVLRRVRRVFDVGADGRAIDAHLGVDARLADRVAGDPGLRVPGAWEGFELAVRAVLGQQVSVAGATTLAARLVQRFGRPEGEGRWLFPDAQALVDVNVAAIGMPETRGEAIRQLARASLDGRVQLGAGITPEELSAQLVALPGIGPWTAQYVAMRALGHPDAFPAEDIVLRKVAVPGRTLGARELLRHAEAWRPWRAYAVMYLWRDAALLRAAAAVARRTASGQPAGG
jgi:AraC family transcriptional regulator of adaptative response / DNA-3-methyladenine glycosylase II